MADSAPLRGITVTELTSNLSGPFAGMLLADQGALVLKVERPGGDETRRSPPHYIEGDSVYFATVNRNKRVIAVDARRDAGADLIRRLVSRSDVFLTNLRPRAVAALGLGYGDLSAGRPDLIYAHITGFGKQTSSANQPAFDLIVQAMGGTMSVTGEQDGAPCRAGLPIGGLNAGIFAALGISNALYRRALTGQGAHLDVSMLGGQLAFGSYLAAHQSADGAPARAHGAGQQSLVPYNRYRCADGKWIVIGAHHDQFFGRLLDVIGRADLLADPRFADRTARERHQAELDGIVAGVIASRECGHWVTELAQAGVPSSAVHDLRQALASPQAREAGLVARLDYPDGGSLTLAADPVKFVGEERPPMARAPRYAQDADWIMRQFLELEPGEIARLVSEGAAPAAG